MKMLFTLEPLMTDLFYLYKNVKSSLLVPRILHIKVQQAAKKKKKKESGCNAGDPGSIPGSGRFPGEGNGYPLQCSGLENPMDRGAWQTIGSQKVRHD